jgi:hypothetical protein
VDPDIESRAREIVLAARPDRRWPRGMWVVAIVISVVCTSALAIAWYVERDTVRIELIDPRVHVDATRL